MKLPIYALALTTFALGTAEFAPNGQLLSLSQDLPVTVADSGLITTAFALGATVGGPLIAAATLRRDHKNLALWLVGIFFVANVVTALSPTLLLAAASRTVAGAMLGAFLGVAITIASNLVAPERRAAAIATVFLGFTAANVLGVVAGNLAGDAWGWRSVFWLVGLLSVVALAGMWLALPPGSETKAAGGTARALRKGRLWVAFAAIALGYGGLFVMFTYIAPILQDAGVPAHLVVWFLLIFGLGLMAGNHFAGRLADRTIPGTTLAALALLIAALAVFPLVSGNLTGLAVLLVLLGAAGFGLVPPLQSFVLEIARVNSPVVSALAAAAFNAGVAMGSAIGGSLVRGGTGYGQLALVGSIVSGLGLLVFVVAVALQKRATRSGAQAPAATAVSGGPGFLADPSRVLTRSASE